MLAPDVIEKVENLAREVAGREGCELYDIEFAGHSGRRTLRVYIDKIEGGIGIEDCSNVSRGLSLLLDVEDPIQGAYDLEVSSPGLDRVLRKPWHYSRVVGKKIWVRLNRSLEQLGVTDQKLKSAKQVSEVLVAADEAGISFQIGEATLKIPFDAVEKGKVVFDFDSDKGSKKGEKKK